MWAMIGFWGGWCGAVRIAIEMAKLSRDETAVKMVDPGAACAHTWR